MPYYVPFTNTGEPEPKIQLVNNFNMSKLNGYQESMNELYLNNRDYLIRVDDEIWGWVENEDRAWEWIHRIADDLLTSNTELQIDQNQSTTGVNIVLNDNEVSDEIDNSNEVSDEQLSDKAEIYLVKPGWVWGSTPVHKIWYERIRFIPYER